MRGNSFDGFLSKQRVSTFFNNNYDNVVEPHVDFKKHKTINLLKLKRFCTPLTTDEILVLVGALVWLIDIQTFDIIINDADFRRHW